jgi:hypothetical protein
MTDQVTGQHWAEVIRTGSTNDGVETVVRAINGATLSKRSNRADVIVVCAQILGQSITPGGPFIAAEMRQGIMALIEGYAMQVALGADL